MIFLRSIVMNFYYLLNKSYVLQVNNGFYNSSSQKKSYLKSDYRTQVYCMKLDKLTNSVIWNFKPLKMFNFSFKQSNFWFVCFCFYYSAIVAIVKLGQYKKLGFWIKNTSFRDIITMSKYCWLCLLYICNLDLLLFSFPLMTGFNSPNHKTFKT